MRHLVKNKFTNKTILFYVIISKSIFSSSFMDLDCATASFSSSSIKYNVNESLIRIVESGLEHSICSQKPNALIEYLKAQYGDKAVNLVEVLSNLALSFSQITSERTKNIMILLTKYIVMSSDSFASNYDALALEGGVNLKILDRMTALTRKQKTHATGGKIHLADGETFNYEEKLKKAAEKRKGIHGKDLEKPISIEDIEY
jgi:hypothetical protein